MASQRYSFVESMEPINIKQNTAIPLLFIFEYFMQKDIALKIDETLEKSCLFNYSESDGGMISTRIVRTKLRRELEFMGEARSSEITEKFQKKRREKIQVTKALIF